LVSGEVPAPEVSVTKGKSTHKDVEFAVSAGERPTRHFSRWDEAVLWAVAISGTHGTEAVVDVLVHSRAGARHWLGDYGVEQYDEDPEASVFQRISIRVEDKGRIP
jgi:hypothetical protein